MENKIYSRGKHPNSRNGFNLHPYSWERKIRGNFTNEHKQKLSLSHKGNKLSSKAIELNKKRFLENNPMKNIEVRKKVSNTIKNLWKNKEYREKIRIYNNNPSNKYKRSIRMINACKNKELIEKRQKIAKDLWKNKEYREKVFLNIKPNKKEIFLLKLLNYAFPNEWKYVGNGKVWINGKCPDFINVDGKKLLIELYGDYWHKGQNGEDRINHFAKYGFKTLIIWEKELRNQNQVIYRINNFLK